MTFGKEKKASAALNRGKEEALAISQPRGFNIGGLAGANITMGPDGTPSAMGRMPYGDENLTLANRSINDLLKGFGTDLSQNNAITQSLNKLMDRERDSQLSNIIESLNARGQLGGSLEAKALGDMSENFADQSLKTGLAGFDATLQALAALRNETGANIGQQLSPIQLALQGMNANNQVNLARAGIPMQAAQGLGNIELNRQSGLERLVSDSLKYGGQAADIYATFATGGLNQVGRQGRTP